MRRFKTGFLMVFAVLLAVVSSAGAIDEKVISLGESKLITLDNAINMAYQYNLDIRQAGSERGISLSKLKEARAQRGFSFGLNGNYIRTIGNLGSGLSLPVYTPTVVKGINPLTGATTTTFLTVDTFTGAVSATDTLIVGANPNLYSVSFFNKNQGSASFVVKKPVYTFGKIENNIRLNRLGVESSDLQLRRTRLDVALKVRQAYYQYLLAQEFLEVTGESVKQSQAHYDAAKARFDVGASPKFDLIRADVDVATAKENFARAQKGVELARMALNNTIGIDVDSPTKVAKPDLKSDEITAGPEALLPVALKSRPEVKQLELGQRQAGLGARLSRLTPTVGFQGTYSLLSQGSGFGQQDTWQLVLAADVPMFDNGVSKAKIKQAQQTREKLAQTEEQLRQGISLQVSEAFLSMKEAAARLDTSNAILEMAQESVRMAEIGYKEGVTTNLDVIDAQHGLNGARLNYAQAHFDYEIAKARLLDAVGLDSDAELFKALAGR